jgi:hypothetical protein
LPEGGRTAHFDAAGDGVRIEGPFGSWSVSTDAIMGGTSTAQATVTKQGALRLTGKVVKGGAA